MSWGNCAISLQYYAYTVSQGRIQDFPKGKRRAMQSPQQGPRASEGNWKTFVHFRSKE